MAVEGESLVLLLAVSWSLTEEIFPLEMNLDNLDAVFVVKAR